jgi:hypothetical protein
VTGSRRWKFYDPVLLWLFPPTYVLHLAEEWFVSAPILLWIVRLDRPLTGWAFLVPSACALALMITGVSLVNRGVRYHWIAPAIATALLLNAAGHLVGSVLEAQYSAGLMTAAVLWVPLGLLLLLRVWDQAGWRTWRAGLGVGALIELIVVLVMFVSAR